MRKSIWKQLRYSITVGITALALVHCGKAAEEVAEEAAEQAIEAQLGAEGGQANLEINEDDGSVSMTVSGGEGGDISIATGDKAEVPADFPSDVPQYPGLDIQSATAMQVNEAFMLQGTTDDAVDAVLQHLKTEAEKQGWTETTSFNQQADGQSLQMLGFSKDDRSLNYMIMVQDGKTNVSITTAKK
jgi:hypothetical protein